MGDEAGMLAIVLFMFVSGYLWGARRPKRLNARGKWTCPHCGSDWIVNTRTDIIVNLIEDEHTVTTTSDTPDIWRDDE